MCVCVCVCVCLAQATELPDLPVLPGPVGPPARDRAGGVQAALKRRVLALDAGPLPDASESSIRVIDPSHQSESLIRSTDPSRARVCLSVSLSLSLFLPLSLTLFLPPSLSLSLSPSLPL